MNRIFREILVSVEKAPNAHELQDCMDELKAIHNDLGDNHQHAVFAQVYGHSESPSKFYLTGGILAPDQAHRIKAILSE